MEGEEVRKAETPVPQQNRIGYKIFMLILFLSKKESKGISFFIFVYHTNSPLWCHC